MKSYLCIFIGFLSFSFSVSADEYHYNNLLIGGNAIGLGGAFVAIADDISATHYNPAGLAFSKVNKTASINTFAWEQTEFTNIFGNGDDFTRDSFSVVPGFFGFSQRYDKFTVATSFTVTDFSNERTSKDAIYEVEPPEGVDSQSITEFIQIDLDNSAYKLAVSGAYQASKNLAYGVSLQIEYRDFKTLQGSGTISTLGVGELSLSSGFDATRRFTDTTLIFQPSFGMKYQSDGLSTGLRVGKEFNLSRDYDVTSSIFVSSLEPLPPFVNSSSRINQSSNEKQDLPWHLAAGIAYEWSDWLISFDATYYSKVEVKETIVEDLDTPITRDLKQVTNYALGLAYSFSDTSSLKLGLFTDNSNAVIDTSIDFQRAEDIDLVGVSLAYETLILDYPVTFGVYHKSGTGDVRTADIRTVEKVVGIPLYRPAVNFDIVRAKKRALIAYFSLNF